MKIGFIGLGNMGAPMALNLLKAGHAVSVFDVNAKSIQKSWAPLLIRRPDGAGVPIPATRSRA